LLKLYASFPLVGWKSEQRKRPAPLLNGKPFAASSGRPGQSRGRNAVVATDENETGRAPGAIIPAAGFLTLNAGRPTVTIRVVNTGDRPVQVGSHYHFFEANRALQFDRAAALGFRLDIPAGTAVRFEPGEEKEVSLTAFGGQQRVLGLNGLTEGVLTDQRVRSQAIQRATSRGFVSKRNSVEEG
jgi:urease beta subunit